MENEYVKWRGDYWIFLGDQGVIIDPLVILPEKDAEIARLQVERDDLAAKLEEANAELHDLRIKVGLR